MHTIMGVLEKEAGEGGERWGTQALRTLPQSERSAGVMVRHPSTLGIRNLESKVSAEKSESRLGIFGATPLSVNIVGQHCALD